MALYEIAAAIWSKLGENERANAATTIAVVQCTDKKLYCTSNDVSVISKAAIAEAKKQGISPIGEDYISQSGAGFHAEMWAVIQAMHADKVVSKVLSVVGASRACCKQCSDMLEYLKVKAEQPGAVEFKSWTNPLTVGEDSQPRFGFKKSQLAGIPDLRQHGNNYWFVSAGSKVITQKEPPDYL